MAAYGSSNTATQETFSGVHTLTITKPTGLATDDFLVAFIGANGTGGSGTNQFATPSGWDELLDNDDVAIYSKLADSSDAAASNFSWATGDLGSNDLSSAGVLYRVTGTFVSGTTLFVVDSDSVSSDSTPTYPGGVIPVGASAFLIMGAVTFTAGVTSSAYAVTNNDPTWTERADIDLNGTSFDVTLSSATGSYSAGTTTGDYSLTLSNTVNSRGYILAISDSVDASGTTALHSVTPTFFAPNGSADTTGTTALHSVTPTFPTLSGKAKSPTNVWTDEEKTTGTWVDEERP